MKAIILAGGLGTRLGQYTQDKPKCMLEFLDKTLLERQVDAFRRADISDIIVVRKHLKEKIQIPGVRYIDETDYDTHMVVGLFEARKEFTDDVLLCYGDILFEDRVLQKAMHAPGEVGVLVDTDWKDYWNGRFGDWQLDSESMVLAGDKIVSLGKPDPTPAEMDARYVGMIKFNKDTWKKVSAVYDNAKETSWEKPWHFSKSFKKAYMTDFMQELIDKGVDVRAIKIQRGWLEFDTVDDYEKTLQWHKYGTLEKFCKLPK